MKKIILLVFLCLSANVSAGVNKILDVEWRTVYNHSYNRVDTLRMDVFEPSRFISGKPAIIFLSGGGSVQVHKQANAPFREYFAQRGYWVASIEVRLTHPDSAHNCMAYIGADMASAISWVRENADSLGVNTERVFAAGTSMGASAAMTVAYVDTSFLLDEHIPFDWKPTAIASFSGTLTWDPVWPCNLLNEIEQGEPETRVWIGKKDPKWELQKKTFIALRNVQAGNGVLLNWAGHGISNMGEIYCAEQAYSFFEMW